MAEDIYKGSNGREHCPASGSNVLPLAIFVGYGAPTPNSKGQPFVSNCNPYNPGDPRYPSLPACPYATVSGDGTMPYGTALDTGGDFAVNSPSIGNVIASPDDQAFWRNYLSASGAGTATATDLTIGYFTGIRRYTFTNSAAVLQIYQVQNGLHLSAGTRYDYSAAGRILDFLLEFSRTDGTVAATGGAYNAVNGTYANLSGNY